MPGSPLTGTAPVPAVGPSRLVATSPAVGYFRPQVGLRAGTKVRAGDRIGSVDVLGIGQDVVAPGDGLIGATLVEAGEPVEYGQAIIVLEQLTEPRLQPPGAVPGEPVPAEPAPADASIAAVGSDTVESARDATPPARSETEPEAAPAAGPDSATDPDASQPAEAD
jgi:pyruvate/2-oxoglutarate dehydrogenase complex dihydrolipoamide acyltransferase (E2) component